MSKNEVHVVAIGSSAGGLEAISNFLRSFNPDGLSVAVIIAQHLSPQLDSHLGDLLLSLTSLKVKTAVHYSIVKPGFLYITPPDFDIEIIDHRIVLSEPSTIYKPSINRLFTSVAKDYRKKAIGIILSGTGNDGAEGISDIANEGGLTLVQDLNEAKYNGMPTAALSTYKVLSVMKTGDMGVHISNFIQNGSLPIINDVIVYDSSVIITKILDLLTQKTGMDFSNYKISTIQRRIEMRMIQLLIHDVEKYHAFVVEPAVLGMKTFI